MKNIRKTLRTVLFITIFCGIAVGASACKRHHSGPAYQSWYDVYGNYCGNNQPRPGCNFYANGSKVIDSSDPYYYSSYSISYNTWFYTDSYGFSRTYTGWAWLSPTGILYTDFGNALNEDADKEGVDVIADAAQAAQEVVKNVGHSVSSRYGLAEDVSLHIATTLNDFAVIGKSRARTAQDTADFTKRLYGVSVEATTLALDKAKLGDTQSLESLNGEVANYWGTNPETSRAILKKWFKDEISEYGVR